MRTAAATYSYLANSALVSHISFSRGSTVMTTDTQYDNLNRLTRIQSGAGVSPVADFQYGYNSANQRTNIVLGPDNSRWAFGYDPLGQVTSGKKHWPDGTPVAGQQFEYQFDSIGNRKQTQAGGDNSGAGLRPAAYTNNLLNQIVGRGVPRAADVLGMVHASASVTVNGQVTSRKGEYFWKEVSANNTNSVVYLGITNQAVLAGTTNNATGNLLLPMAGQRYWYDADGNMLSDGVWTNTWDAENRLVSTETTAAVPEVARAKEIWSYYADGRWSERAVYAWTNGNWVAQATQRFVWDGNVIVAIVDGNNGLLQTFLRGLDLSGTMQGAGGAGGLLAIGDVPSVMTSFYVHDGNGNVVALVSASDGSVVARYEYGPFGEPIRMTGPMAQVSPMRFSGQFTDDTRTTVKCLFRDYSCATGRWCSRDPISENGGPNLYAAVANHPIGSSDRFGKTILGPDGDTSRFGPLDLAATIPTFWITVTKVEIPDGGCACLLDEASWDTRVHIYYNASVTGGSALVTLAEITMHEMVHAIADEEWARKALPAEIGLCSIICGCLQVHGGGCVGFS